MTTIKNSTSHLSIEEVRIERSRYDLLLQQKLFSIDFNEKRYKKVNFFIYITVILGGFFTWSSSSPESNIYSLVKKIVSNINSIAPIFSERGFIITLIMLLLIIPLFSILVDINKVKLKIKYHSLVLSSEQTRLFMDFISKKIEVTEQIEIKSFKDVVEFLKEQENGEIKFDASEFARYLQEEYEIKDLNTEINFFDVLSNLILLNQCVKKPLSFKVDGDNNEYSFNALQYKNEMN